MKSIVLAVLIMALSPAGALAQAAPVGDAVKGAVSFKSRCSSCHTINGEDGEIAPSLKGVVNRKAGAGSKTFPYTDAIRKSGKTWTQAELATFLAAPQKEIPGTAMAAMVPNPQDRADIIAYLATLK